MAVKCQLPAIGFLGCSEVSGPTSADASGFAHPHSCGCWWNLPALCSVYFLVFGAQPGLLLLLFWFSKPFLESHWLGILLRSLSCRAVIHLFQSSTGWLWSLCVRPGFLVANSDGCGLHFLSALNLCKGDVMYSLQTSAVGLVLSNEWSSWWSSVRYEWGFVLQLQQKENGAGSHRVFARRYLSHGRYNSLVKHSIWAVSSWQGCSWRD